MLRTQLAARCRDKHGRGRTQGVAGRASFPLVKRRSRGRASIRRMQLAELAAPLARELSRRGESVAVAETSSGGLISAALLAVPGASAYYRGGSVLYTAQARRALAGIDREAIAGLEPLSEAMVARFAEIGRRQLDATWCIAELGAAGPTGTPYGHPAGTCVVAVDGPIPLQATVRTGSGDREANMWRFAREALMLLDRALAEVPD